MAKHQPHNSADDERLDSAETKSESSADASEQKDSKSKLLDTYIGEVKKGPQAAKKFNDLVAKTLKLD